MVLFVFPLKTDADDIFRWMTNATKNDDRNIGIINEMWNSLSKIVFNSNIPVIRSAFEFNAIHSNVLQWNQNVQKLFAEQNNSSWFEICKLQTILWNESKLNIERYARIP